MKEQNFGSIGFEGFPHRGILDDGSKDFGDGIIGPSASDIESLDKIYYESLNQVVSDGSCGQITDGFKPREISPFPFADRIPRRLRKPLILGGALVPLSLVAAICGGGEEKDEGGQIGPEGERTTNELRLPFA